MFPCVRLLVISTGILLLSASFLQAGEPPAQSSKEMKFQDYAEKWFKKADLNKDQFLDESEWAKVFRGPKAKPFPPSKDKGSDSKKESAQSPERELIETYDQDGDEKINWKEFLVYAARLDREIQEQALTTPNLQKQHLQDSHLCQEAMVRLGGGISPAVPSPLQLQLYRLQNLAASPVYHFLPIQQKLLLQQQQVQVQRQLTTPVPGRPGGGRPGFRVLFIGNSYTAANGLPQMIADLAQAANAPALEFDVELVGGSTLMEHWQRGRALQKIRQGSWDFVILQEQSMLPILSPSLMLEAVLRLNQEIRKTGAKTLLYLTWARKTLPQTQPLLNSAYYSAAQACVNAQVVPVGLAWHGVRQQNPNLALHEPDGSHPNFAGSYLAACVFYSAIYHHSPEGLPAGNLASPTARFLQTTAAQTTALTFK